jgi:mono/diheme cytochrome c family protein
MSDHHPDDERPDQARMTDGELLESHEKLLGRQPDDRAQYRLMPLAMLFVLSACILFAATYLNRYSGHFDRSIYDENKLPSKGGLAEAKPDPVALGRRMFNAGGACYSCHQPNGLGIPGAYPPLAGSEWVNGTEERVVRIVLDGLQGAVHVKGMTFSAAAMPAFGQSGFNWSDDQLAGVLSYVRQEWGNKAPAVTSATVARIRQETADHKAWSESDLLGVK